MAAVIHQRLFQRSLQIPGTIQKIRCESYGQGLSIHLHWLSEA